VTCETEQHVLALDLERGQAVGRFDTRQEGSHVLAYEPASRTLSVSNTDSGSLTLINVDSGDTSVVELAGGSEGSLVLADRVWVGNAWDGSVSVVDIRAAKVVAQVDSVCNFPISLGKGLREQVWVACFGSAELVSINSDSFVVERRIELDYQPLNLLLHPGRDLAYISLPRQNAIAEIDLDSGRELRRINVGIEPDGLRWAGTDHASLNFLVSRRRTPGRE
jgi:DNA-binding beta-propeller fold protein YncE